MDARPIRKLIEITESMMTQIPQELIPQPVVFEPPVLDQQLDADLEIKLEGLIFKLNSYQDPDMGEYSAGVEAGMSRAADMLQNLLNRLKG
jgi:hypothetical protein